MTLNIKPVINEYNNCVQGLIETVGKYYNRDYELIYSSCGGVLYNPNVELLSEIIKPIYFDTTRAMRDYCGLYIQQKKYYEVSTLIEVIIENINRGIPVIVSMDSFNCPWSRAFHKYHFPHSILIIGYEGDRKFICIDTYSSIEDYIECDLEVLNNIEHREYVIISKQEYQPGPIDLKDVIYRSARSSCPRDNMLKFLSDVSKIINRIFKREYNKIDVSNNSFIVRLTQIANASDSNKLFWEYLKKRNCDVSFDEFIQIRKKITQMWKQIKMLIIKEIVAERDAPHSRLIKEMQNLVSDIITLETKTNDMIDNLIEWTDELDTSFLYDRFAEYSDTIAIVSGNIKYSYNQLDSISNNIADILNSYYRQNAVVGLYLERNIYLLPIIVGIFKANHYYVPLDISFPKERLKAIIKSSNINSIITQKKFITTLKDIGYSGNIYDSEKMIEDYPSLGMNVFFRSSIVNLHNGIAYSMYTSGSTGKPKGINIAVKNLKSFADNFMTDRIIKGKKILASSNMSFDISIVETLIALSRGLTVVLADDRQRKNPKMLANLIEEHNIDIIQLTPSMASILFSDSDRQSFENVSTVLVGGEPLPEALLTHLKRHTKARIYNLYGPTETTIWCTLKDLTDSERVTIGKPFGENKIYIIDEEKNLIENNDIGEIYIGGSQLADGYVNNAELNDKIFIPNPFIPGTKMYKSGDLGRWLPNGEIEFIGRKDYQIKFRGHRIELKEIELNIATYNSIKEAVVLLINNNKINNYLYCFYTSEVEISGEKIGNYLNEKLPEYMIPSFFKRIDCFPLTPNGKIDRNTLKESAFDIKSDDTVTLQKRQNNEDNKIINMFRGNLAYQEIGSITYNSSLKEIGLNSVSFMRLIVAFESEFDIEFDSEELDFDKYRTIEDIKICIDKKVMEKSKVQSVVENCEGKKI